MSVEKKVPEIRFKGFSEAWVDSDLKSFSDSFSYGLNASAVKFDGVNKYLRITDIDEKSRRFDYCQLTSPDADLSKSDNYLLKNGDILFARTGASVGKTYIYNEQDGKVYFAGFLIRASINHKASAQFIFQNTQTHKYARFVAATSQRSGQPGINAKEYGEYRLFSPTVPEQTQIGSYFQKLDALINQHQQKYDKLSSIKKAMLGKMFPKSGETIPEIRFKGFSGAWKEKTLGEIGDTYPGLSGKTKDDFGHGQGRFVTYLNVFSNAISNENLLEPIEFDTNQNEVKKGDVFFTTSSETPEEVGMSSVWMSEIKNVYLNSFCFGYRPKQKLDNYYLAYLLRSNSFRDKIVFLAQGISRYNISKTKVMDIKISIPEYSEQEKIGNYFQKLEMLINHHQQQITKLNNIKQACLSKMFV
ncbi:restriction endonuclease subunit S [Klebsiella pneumoniae]|uniref:restriction endonuclease subunit S n=1 Tax=Klebsiella pneumoniae TaxID=573 RepID=UPI00228897E1|nr:restriction endonuclease subunit S [Klebsiella pneumoniae]HCT6941270.1 restriction endonuclease subunit S [Klebsiella pneumoniae]